MRDGVLPVKVSVLLVRLIAAFAPVAFAYKMMLLAETVAPLANEIVLAAAPGAFVSWKK